MATIEKRAKGQYRVKIRRKGYPERAATFTTRADAESWARDIEGKIDKGEHIDTGEAARATLADALARYMREETTKKRGAHQERVRILAWLRDPLARRPLSRIRGGDLADYRDARLLGVTVDALTGCREDSSDPLTLKPSRRRVGGNTVRLELAVISHLYTVAREEWGMEGLANPVLAVRKPKLPKGRDRRLRLADKAAGRQAEEKLLLKHADPIMRSVITLAIETAMRRGEIASLERSQIDRRKMIARLEITKNGDGRDVPLSKRALDAIDALPVRLDGYLLGESAANVASWISHEFEDVCDAAGISDLTFHDLRHEAISRLFEHGFRIEEVRAISGHKTLQMLMRYTHLRGEDLAKRLA